MLIKEANFRQLYRNLIIVKSKEDAELQERLFKINSLMDNDEITDDDINSIPIDNDINGFLAVPYIDHHAGLSFLFLTTVLAFENNLKVYKRPNFDTIQTIRKDRISDVEFSPVSDFKIDGDVKYYENYINDVLKYYEAENLIPLREMDIIDNYRNNDFPDDILVLFFKENFQPEGMWVRYEKLKTDCIEGVLLNTPNQDFGIKSGDTVTFNVVLTEDNDYICIKDID